MKIQYTERPLPRRFAWHPNMRGLAHEADLRITPNASLRAKLLVFRHQRFLRRFWKMALGHDLGAGALGAVSSLSHERNHFRDIAGGQLAIGQVIVCDPRYFCLIGLVRGHLTTEVICHESVHAGYAYTKRVERTPWDRHAKAFDEEAIAYPAGVIARRIVESLLDAGLLHDGNTSAEAA